MSHELIQQNLVGVETPMIESPNNHKVFFNFPILGKETDDETSPPNQPTNNKRNNKKTN
jgi:hypothetical protein